MNGYFLRKLPRLSCQGKALACPLDFSGYPDHDRVPGKSHSLWRRRAAETSLPPREKVPSAFAWVQFTLPLALKAWATI